MANGIQTVFHNSFEGRTGFEMKQGSRPWHMLLILSKGSFSYTLSGKEYTVEQDEIAFFPQHADFERKVLSPIDFHQFGFFLQKDAPFEVPESGKLNLPKPQVQAILRSLEQATLYCAHDEKAVYDHILTHILMEHTLFSAHRTRTPVKQESDVAGAIQYMTEHIGEKISMEALAEKLHLSYVGLCRKFKRSMHCSPSDFLIRLRMQYAKQLILDEQKSISEIAELCGYQNAYYFSNAFKKQFHVSPSQYRKKQKQRLR